MKAGRTSDPRLEALQQLDLFRHCPSRELRRVAALTYETVLPAGHRLCRQGEVGRQAFVILEGHATVDVDGTVVGAVGPGDVVGEMALLDSTPRVATVTATRSMRLLVLSASEFHALLADAPVAARRMLAHLGQRLRDADRALVASAIS